jgi:membrane-bound inhibitor of C-type lysozyme
LPTSTRNWKPRRKPFQASAAWRIAGCGPVYTAALRTAIPCPVPFGCGPRGEYRGGKANMNRYKTAIFGAALVVAGGLTGSSPALAQTFESYHCTDGTRFIVGFFKYDTRAHLQIGGQAVTLKKRVALSGSRYSGEGVTLAMTKAGVTVRQARRPVTVCELS